MTKEDLIAFEAEIAAEFNAGRIKAPIHLSGGNEGELIRIFKKIRPQDWVCGQWRMHLHCLLKGVPRERLKQAIMDGHSITLNFPEYKVFSSAIAGGHLPIALGIAWEVKRQGRDEQVYAFLGDMTDRMGLAHECLHYATGWDLPITFVVERNGLSVCTNTSQAWGEIGWDPDDHRRSYSYKMTWPHHGTGFHVPF